VFVRGPGDPNSWQVQQSLAQELLLHVLI